MTRTRHPLDVALAATQAQALSHAQRELAGVAEVVDYLGTGPDRAHLFTVRNGRGAALRATVRGVPATGLTLSVEPV